MNSRRILEKGTAFFISNRKFFRKIINLPYLQFEDAAFLFLLQGVEIVYGSNKKGTYLRPLLIKRKIKMEYRRYANPPETEDQKVCTISDKCKGCPFPSTGFICWGRDGECLRTRFEKLQRKERKDETEQ